MNKTREYWKLQRTTGRSSTPADSLRQQLKLSSPIDSYAPIYREEAAQDKTSDLFKKLTQKSSTISAELDDSVNEASDVMNKVFSYGLVGHLAFAVIKLFKRKEPDMKIGLSQGLNEREIDMYKGSNILNNSYTNSEIPFTNVNYGLNAYKKENQNPYEDQPVQYHNPRMQQYVSPLLRNQQAALQRKVAMERQNVATSYAMKEIEKTKGRGIAEYAKA